MRIMEPMVLLLLAQEPAHGYLLVEQLQQTFQVDSLTPQTVYRILQRLESEEWVVPSWDMDSAQGPPRKVYEVTPAGEAALDTWAQEMDDLRGMLEIFLRRYHAFRDADT